MAALRGQAVENMVTSFGKGSLDKMFEAELKDFHAKTCPKHYCSFYHIERAHQALAGGTLDELYFQTSTVRKAV